tara:strand:+ start:137 stop:1417 length:1281 start_codon:yes stop_codon:yes gene_type:complete
MRKYILLITTMLLANISYSQIKLIEDSGKKPKWLNSLQKDFIIAAGSGTTIEGARNDALMSIKEIVVSSVADNIQVKSELNIIESTESYTETYKTKTTTQSTNTPYIKGISLNKASEFYWEQTKNKDTKEIVFIYHIKYPFSEFELEKIVLDFETEDKILTNKLEELIHEIDSIDDVDIILNNINELNNLAEYFIDQRKKRAELGAIKYQSIIKSILVQSIENKLGKLVFILKFGDREFETSAKPIIVSKCAKNLTTIRDGKYWTVLYDTKNCYNDQENSLNVRYKLGRTRISQIFYFNTDDNKSNIFINDNINFTTINKDAENILESICSIDIISEFNAPILIEKVVLNWNKQTPIIFYDINQEFSGKGNHSLLLNYSVVLNKSIYNLQNQKKSSFLNGIIHYKNVSTGESLTYRIYNRYFTVDW